MYTLAERLGLQLLVERRMAAVFGTAEFVEESNGIANSDDKERADARLIPLVENGLEKVARLKFCTFPMKGRAGLFEIRVNGVRYYGGRIGTANGKDIYVLAGAENKAGRAAADDGLLDRCGETLKGLSDRLTPPPATRGPGRRR